MQRRRVPLPSLPLPLLESLELRRLLHGGVEAAVSFQPGGEVADFLSDTGDAFSFHGGHRYGWTLNGAAWRNTWSGSRQTGAADGGESFIAMGHRAGLAWEMAVPKGRYRVTFGAGDPQYREGESHRIAVEGQVAIDFTATAAEPTRTGTIDLHVNDGRLTVTAPDGTANSKISWIQVQSIDEHDEEDEGEDLGDGGGAQQPFGETIISVPGRIEAEHFDAGGQGVGFFDRDPEVNRGGEFRDDGVDILKRGEATIVGWGARGEWLEYTIQNDADRTVEIKVHAATGNAGGLLRFRVNGELVGSGINLQSSTDWETFRTYSAGTFELPAGVHTLRLVFADSADIDVADVDWIELIEVDPGDGDDGGSAGDVQLGGWQGLPEMPFASLEGASTEVDGTMYIWGGYDQPNVWKSTTRGQAYNIATGQWRQIAPLPIALTHMQAVAWEGRIYLFGGYVNTSTQSGARDDVWVYDPAKDTFTHFIDMPYAVASSGVALDGSRAYVVSGMFRQGYNFAGGSTKVFSIDLADPDAGWRMETDSPVARDHTAALAIDGKVYLVTGQENDSESEGVRPDLHVYDPATRLWTKLANVPDGGRGHIGQSTLAWKGRIILIGGNTNGQPGRNYADEIFIYDPMTDEWGLLGTLSEPRRGAHARVVGEHLYLIGGGDGIPKHEGWRAELVAG